MFGRGGGRARIVARSEVRPRAALFRPEGEKRPLIGAEETERASGASLMLAWILDWAMKLVSFLLYLRIYITCQTGVVGGQGLWRGAK